MAAKAHMFLGSPSFGTPTRLSPLCQGLPVLPLLLSFPRSPPTSSCPYIRTHLDSAVSQPRGLQGPQLGAVLAQGRPGRQHPAECPLTLAPLPSSLQGRCRAGCSWGRCGDLAPSVGTLILGWQSWEDRATWGEALTNLCQAQKSPEAVIDRQGTLKTEHVGGRQPARAFLASRGSGQQDSPSPAFQRAAQTSASVCLLLLPLG